ncbi:alpha-hydroxy acid oxidase [Xinfangfangia pollutisoli]|uniref:alpha-hydroxy acid oxidase n=1 Tax=Xinfangfangia pollutisoli TaxID=2865960 RepID=UPI001CD2774C|nr:alpha-hydroxy acid oxidase [Xinfangfangia pollutisoli]
MTDAQKRPAGSGWGAGAATSAEAKALRRLPDSLALLARARRRVPGFAWDYLEGGVGQELGLARNRQALDRIEILPRYGVEIRDTSTETQLFGQSYALPLGVAPMGLSGLVWPQADRHLALAAARERVGFVLSMVANIDIETAMALAPHSWMQLYCVPKDDVHATFDLAARAQRCGVRTLVLTLDTPMRQKRLRDLRNGLTVPFRPSLTTVRQVAAAPAWAWAMLRHGQPEFSNFKAYAGARASAAQVAAYVDKEMSGAFTWALIARLRDLWPGQLVLKGIQHPQDVLQAVALGVDGVILSNHGGRQFDAAPAAVSLLPQIRPLVGERIKLMVDGAILSGLDILKALVLGADFVFAGRPFLASVAAMGARGPDHLMAIFRNELRGVMAQAGAVNIAALKDHGASQRAAPAST